MLEWIEPIFPGGHWTPEIVQLAGAEHPLNPVRWNSFTSLKSASLHSPSVINFSHIDRTHISWWWKLANHWSSCLIFELKQLTNAASLASNIERASCRYAWLNVTQSVKCHVLIQSKWRCKSFICNGEWQIGRGRLWLDRPLPLWLGFRADHKRAESHRR